MAYEPKGKTIEVRFTVDTADFEEALEIIGEWLERAVRKEPINKPGLGKKISSIAVSKYWVDSLAYLWV